MALVLSRRFMRSNKSQPSLPSLPPLLARFQFLCMEARKRLLVILDSEDDIKIDRAGLRRGRGGRAGLGTVALSESVVPDSTCSRTSRRMTSQREAVLPGVRRAGLCRVRRRIGRRCGASRTPCRRTPRRLHAADSSTGKTSVLGTTCSIYETLR